MKASRYLTLGAGVLTGLLAFSGAMAAPGAPTAKGVQPVEYPGNFVSSDDDQVCYDMSALGYIGEVTGEMIGIKVDPPIGFSDAFITTTISADGKYLDWTVAGAKIIAFIIKGGSSYNLYNYVPFNYQDDQLLHSPVTVKGSKTITPQISHYNVCYEKDPPQYDQGCTPGYWRNHADRWFGVAPTDDFDTIFGVDLFQPNVTLGWAIWATGGGNNALARHATAALLNAYGGVPNGDGTYVMNYPYTVDQVKAMVQAAVANGTIEDTKNLFEAANELGCPLTGTKAVDVPR
jgi:hypothetical protein